MNKVNPEDRRVANIHTAEFRDLPGRDGKSIGQSVLQLNRSQPDGVGFHIYQMAPGMTTEAHEHTEDEEFLVLSGDLTDNDGTRYQEGDLVWLRKGTQHSSTTVNGCVLAVFIARAEVEILV